MKIVLQYTETDSYTYWEKVNLTFEYVSPEISLNDFETALETAIADDLENFRFAGHEFAKRDFYKKNVKILPDMFTLDEWFEQNRVDR